MPPQRRGDTTSAPATANVPRARDFGVNDARDYRERGILAYRDGDIYLALADFDLAIELDPHFCDAYIDRGVALYRLGELSVHCDIATAKRIAELNRRQSPRRAKIELGCMPVMALNAASLANRRTMASRLVPEGSSTAWLCVGAGADGAETEKKAPARPVVPHGRLTRQDLWLDQDNAVDFDIERRKPSGMQTKIRAGGFPEDSAHRRR